MIKKIYDKVYFKFYGLQLKKFDGIKIYFKSGLGLEIGGPSQIFQPRNILPIYALADRIDGCNFSSQTIWEGEIKEGQNYCYSKYSEVGFQYITEGNDLKQIKSNTYDFLLSSHSLEHFANPLKAIAEWKRVVKPGGIMVFVLPNSKFTFDHKRPITTFKHLLSDFENDVSEHDLTHLDEILQLHDLFLDKPAGDLESFKKRSLQNFVNRCLHHHVFDLPLIKETLKFFEMKIVFSGIADPIHLIVLGKKIA